MMSGCTEAKSAGKRLNGSPNLTACLEIRLRFQHLQPETDSQQSRAAHEQKSSTYGEILDSWGVR